MGWIAVIVAVAVVAVVAAVLASRRSPAALSEEHPHPRQPQVVDRPAGPDAEATGIADGGDPATGVPLSRQEGPPPRPAGEPGDLPDRPGPSAPG